jgi:integrase
MVNILNQRKVDTHAQGQGDLTTGSALINKRVSQWSMFNDQEWILSAKHTIYWAKPSERAAQLDEASFQTLMEPVKALADILLNEEGLRPATVCIQVGALKEFAGWMLARPVAIKHFRDVTNSVLTDYSRQISGWQALRRKSEQNTGYGKTLCASYLRRKVRALIKLYDYRGRLDDALQRMPLDLLAIPSQEEKGGSDVWGGTTAIISDEAHKELLQTAVNFLREYADHIIADLKKFIKDSEVLRVAEVLSSRRDTKGPQDIKKKLGYSIGKAIRIGRATGRFKMGSLKRLRPGTPLSISNLATEADVPFELCVDRLIGRTRLKHEYSRTQKILQAHLSLEVRSLLLTRVHLLQIACFIIVASSTGMRLGELLNLKPGCLAKKRIRGYEGVLYWLKSILTKTSPNLNGEIAYWLCGELAAEAIRVLERLHALMPTTLTTKQKPELELGDSLFRAYLWNGVTLEVRQMTQSTVYRYTRRFIKELKLGIGYVHPHQFRRTFARNVVRWSNAPILALQRHFKHWSLLMTDYYVGVDDQLVQLYFSEQQTDSRNRLRQIMAGECGGPGGLISQKRLAKMADNEELPLNFRGEEYTGTIEDLVDEISRDGVVAFKCGDFTTCLYVPGLAKCGEDGPKAHECHPTECLNSFILVEDVPFYLHNIRQNLSSYKKQREIDKKGPIGLFYLKRIWRDVVSILPLIQLYSEKLGQLRNHYDGLTETEKTDSYGKVLKDRIERDIVTLEFVAGGGHV